ncbi:MAG: hypothetical protein KJN71_06275, partial [Acidimicrobiia bacterium]|nr:hypothetical protein [Acidimicrobiia bacterium]
MASNSLRLLVNSPLRRAVTLFAAFSIAMSSLAFVVGSAEALGARVGGQVLSDASEPFAGVEVWLFEDDGNGQPGPEDTAVDGPFSTRDDGTYDLTRPNPDTQGWVVVVVDGEVRLTDDVVCLPSAGGLFPGEHPGCVAVVPVDPGVVEVAPVVLTVESESAVPAESLSEATEDIQEEPQEVVAAAADDVEPEVVETEGSAGELVDEDLVEKILEIPLGFEQVLGTAGGDVAFAGTTPGYAVQLSNSAAARVSVSEEDAFTIAMRGASEPSGVVTDRERPGVSNYLIGNDPDEWVTGVKSYGAVTFTDIYDGIDVMYQGNGKRLQYDFIVSPGADPSQVEFEIGDATAAITDEGTLLVTLASAEQLIIQTPYAYQDTPAGRVDVEVSFIPTEGGFAFSLGAYDAALPLVIDPTVDWATYIDTATYVTFTDITVDGAGNVFVTGHCAGCTYPITAGVVDPVLAGTEAVISKLNPTATALIWSTYMGGDASETASSIEVAADGTIYVGGQTWSSNFPMPGGGYDTSFDGGSEGFITRLNSTATAIVSATFLGGTNNSPSDDEVNDLHLHSGGQVYVAGHTRDSDFPTTGGVLQGSYGGGMYDGFLARLDASLSTLQHSTFVGGSGIDVLETLEVTAGGVIFAAGGGGSTDFPITPVTAYQSSNPSGQSGKVIAVDPGFSGVIYGSYLGGAGSDRVLDSVMVSDTEFVVVGYAASQDLPTRNAVQPAPGDASSFTDDGFIAKFDLTGSGPSSAPFVTYMGGNADDEIHGVALTPTGDIVFSGWTKSTNLSTTPDAIDATFQGADDIMFGTLAGDGSSLTTLSYYGGVAFDRSYELFVDGSGAIYLAAVAKSSGLATPGVIDTVPDATSYAGFVAKLLQADYDVTLLADSGGAGPGEDLLTQADTGNSDPATNEASVGTGTGTTTLRAMDFHPVTEVLYAGGGSTFGTINQSSGVFTSIGTFGSGNGSSGVRTFDNVQALAFDPTSGVLYAVHVEGTSDSYLFAVDPATGSAVTDFFGSDEYVRIQTTATRKLVWAIAIDDLGQMYGIQTSSGDGAVRFVRINKVTGARNDVSTLDTYILRGMTLTDTGELWVSGKTTGPTVHGMYRINPATGAIVETVPIDNGADYQSIAAQLTLTATLITGTVFEDITGDALHDGGYPGDAGDNPPVAGAQVYLYVDAGTAGPDNGDALSGVVPNPATTDANGHYAFYGVPDGNYYVVVDSRTIAPTAGINGGFAQGDVWAQQTYGGIGTAFGAGAGWGWSATPRAVYGGYSGYQTAVAVSDTFTPATPGDAEHVNRVVVSGGASVTDVDLGFSFNVVTNLGAPGTEDDDGGANRTVQGSLRQFIQNANAIVGPNAMYFATEPVFDPTDTAGIHEWYSTTITNNLPTITDPDTTIDGSLWDSTRSGLGNARNINSVTLGYVGGVGTGADGVSGNGDDMTLDGVPGPELEINDGPGSTSGILSTASRTTVQHISIWGFGVVGDDGNIRIGPHGSNITGIDINNVVLGTGANALADPGASRTLGSNVIAEDATSGGLPAELNSITDSILVFTDASNVSLANEGGWLIRGNEINGAGIGAANGQYKDAISLGGSPSGHTIIGNYIGGAHGVGVDTWQDPGGHTVTDNTITNNGLSVIVEEQAGVRLFGTGSTVEHNIISGNTGAAVIIVGERQPTLPTWSAGTGNLISENEFGANTTISIDLVEATDSDITHGLGDGVNGNNSDNNELTTGNLGIDSPVITAAVSSGGSVTVSGTQFNCDTCTVEVYAAVADGDGSDTVGLDDFGEAITYLGSATVSGTTWSLVATPAVIPTDVTALVFDGASNTSELAQNEPVVLAADFVGRVFHDIVGDQLADDGDADLETNDANNPWLPGVDVYLYEDTGPLIGQPDVVDALYVGPTNPVTTDANGRFQFLGLPAGRTFYVVVDSTTVSPPATTASTDSYWAEQTYGPAGSLVGGAPTGVNGPLYGGDDAAVADTFGGTTLTGAEHIARLA